MATSRDGERLYVLRDRTRARVLVSIALLTLLFGALISAGAESAAARTQAMAAFIVIAGAFLLPARLAIEVRGGGIRLRGYLHNRTIAWSEISHFGLQKLPGRGGPVPTVVLATGKRLPLHGLDSTLSSFGVASPMWEEGMTRLTRELADRRGLGSSAAR